jgi:hypothetical protein
VKLFIVFLPSLEFVKLLLHEKRGRGKVRPLPHRNLSP